MSLRISTTSYRRSEGPPDRGRRALLCAVPALVLAGCSSDQNSAANYGAFLLKSGLNPFGPPPAITRNQAAAVKYASIGLRVGDTAQLMLVLAEATTDTKLWSSAAHIALQTRFGRIIRTSGLDANLSDTLLTMPDPLATGFAGGDDKHQFLRSVDFADRSLYGVTIASHFSEPVRQDIEIIGATIKTFHVRETCTCAFLDWNFENQYWADINTGMIWRSIQSTHPALDPLQIDVLRPATS